MAPVSAGWDLLADLQLLLQYHFMENALLAGAVVAVSAGATGWFVVLRGQGFAAHMLSQVGFPGAALAGLLGLPAVAGLLGFALAAALGVGLLGRDRDVGRRWEAAVVGTVLAFALGLGLLFVRLYGGSAAGIYGLLFGSILGISDADLRLTVLAAAVTLTGLAVMARPLLFASVDPGVAAARGVPMRAIAIAFLLLLGLAVAQAVQMVGTLLIFALLVAPAAASQQLTARPWRGLLLAVVIALACTLAGLAVAYFSVYPSGFFITSFAFAANLLARLGRRRAGPPALPPVPAGVVP